MLKVIIIILLCAGCTNSIQHKVINVENKLVINTININNKISISSIKESINGIVMFSEYGRPDVNDSNTIIGAHSGFGSNSYFNLLDKLAINDEILIIYNNKEYRYYVNKIYEVDEKDISPLENTNNTLTLMTCKLDDSSKRIVVVAYK